MDSLFVLLIGLSALCAGFVIVGVIADRWIEPWLDRHYPEVEPVSEWEDMAERERDDVAMMAEFSDLPESLKNQAE